MKKGLDKAGTKKHLMIQPIGYLTPVLGKEGFTGLAEFPYGMFVRRGKLNQQDCGNTTGKRLRMREFSRAFARQRPDHRNPKQYFENRRDKIEKTADVVAFTHYKTCYLSNSWL